MIKNSELNETLRQRNTDRYHNAALYWNKLANERLFEVSKQLLAISLVILPLTGAIVLADKTINAKEGSLLLYGWGLLFISVGSGFYNFWTEAQYFNYLSKDSSTRESISSDPNLSGEEIDKRITKLDKTKPNSSFVPLIIQAGTLLVGVFLIMLVIYHLLFQDQQNDYRSKNLRGNYYLHRF